MAPEIHLHGALIDASVVLTAPRDIAEYAFRAKQGSACRVLDSLSELMRTVVLTAMLIGLLHGGVIAGFAATAIAAGVAGLSRTSPEELPWKQVLFLSKCAGDAGRLGNAVFVTVSSCRVTADLCQSESAAWVTEAPCLRDRCRRRATQTYLGPFVLINHDDWDGSRTIGRVATHFAIIGMALGVLSSSAAAVSRSFIRPASMKQPPRCLLLLTDWEVDDFSL